jgi:hypothetical protein
VITQQNLPAVTPRLPSALLVAARYTYWVLATRPDGTPALPTPCDSLAEADRRRAGFVSVGYLNARIHIRRRGMGAPRVTK